MTGSMLFLAKWDGTRVEIHDELMHGSREVAEHRLVSLVELVSPTSAVDPVSTKISLVRFITDIWRIIDDAENFRVFGL